MWRMTVAVLVVVIGCSARSDLTAEQTTGNTRQEAATTTLADVVSDKERFVEQVRRRLDYDDPSLEDSALGMATHMCEALDIIWSAEDTAGGPSDAERAELASAGLNVGMNNDLDDGVTAVIYAIGAEQLCPAHTEFVSDYLAARGLPHT